MSRSSLHQQQPPTCVLYDFELYVSKIFIKLRFPCSFTLAWKVDSIGASSKNLVKPSDNCIQFNTHMRLESVPMMFNHASDKFQEKKSLVSLFLVTAHKPDDAKLAGVITIDLAQVLNQRRSEGVPIQKPLEKCPDRESHAAYMITAVPRPSQQKTKLPNNLPSQNKGLLMPPQGLSVARSAASLVDVPGSFKDLNRIKEAYVRPMRNQITNFSKLVNIQAELKAEELRLNPVFRPSASRDATVISAAQQLSKILFSPEATPKNGTPNNNKQSKQEHSPPKSILDWNQLGPNSNSSVATGQMQVRKMQSDPLSQHSANHQQVLPAEKRRSMQEVCNNGGIEQLLSKFETEKNVYLHLLSRQSIDSRAKGSLHEIEESKIRLADLEQKILDYAPTLGEAQNDNSLKAQLEYQKQLVLEQRSMIAKMEEEKQGMVVSQNNMQQELDNVIQYYSQLQQDFERVTNQFNHLEQQLWDCNMQAKTKDKELIKLREQLNSRVSVQALSKRTSPSDSRQTILAQENNALKIKMQEMQQALEAQMLHTSNIENLVGVLKEQYIIMVETAKVKDQQIHEFEERIAGVEQELNSLILRPPQTPTCDEDEGSNIRKPIHGFSESNLASQGLPPQLGLVKSISNLPFKKCSSQGTGFEDFREDRVDTSRDRSFPVLFLLLDRIRETSVELQKFKTVSLSELSKMQAKKRFLQRIKPLQTAIFSLLSINDARGVLNIRAGLA